MQHLVDTGISLALAIGGALTSMLINGVKRLLGHKINVLPQLYYQETDFSRYLIENCSALSRVFKPPWWMANGHAQTILAGFLPKTPMEFKRELMDLDDGGVLALDWGVTGSKVLTSNSPVCFILPGLAGDALGYTNLAKCAIAKGFRPVVFNKRGHGQAPLRTPKLQSFGDPADFKQAIDCVGRKFPEAKLTAIGISAGSGLLASYLGEEKDETPLVANVGMCPGYDADKLFKEYLRPPYDFLLLRGLKQIIRHHKDVLGTKFDLSNVLSATTVHEVEERLYCKIYGYKTVAEYWKNNNPMRAVYDVKRPMLCISSRDDPVCQEGLIPFEMFEKNEHVMLAALDKGGHCGFIEEGTLTNWADRVSVDYIASVLDYIASQEQK